MNSHDAEGPSGSRRVRICRPAFQDMHHLVVPRLAARAQLRRHAMKLRFEVLDPRRCPCSRSRLHADSE